MTRPDSTALTRALFFGLCLWGVGAQVDEAMASVGLWFTVALALVAISRRADPPRWRNWWPLWLFLLWAIAAPLLAGRLPGGTGLARLADWLGIPAAAVVAARLDPRRRALWYSMCASVFVLSCGVAGLQSYGVWPPPDFWSRLPWHSAGLLRVYEPAPGGRFMAGGLLFHRLKFAHVGGLLVLSAFGWAVRGEGRSRWLGAAVAAVGFYAVAAFPFARGALVALATSIAWVGVIGARRRLPAMLVAVAALVALGGAVLLSPTLRERFEGSLTPEGNGDRSAIWATGFRAVRAHPWVGLGVGRFHPAEFSPPNVRVHAAAETVKAHDQYLTWAAEIGLPGALGFLLLLGWLGTRLDPHAPAGLGGLGALLFFALLSLGHDPLFHAPFSMGLALVVGHGVGRGPRQRPGVGGSADPPVPTEEEVARRPGLRQMSGRSCPS